MFLNLAKLFLLNTQIITSKIHDIQGYLLNYTTHLKYTCKHYLRNKSWKPACVGHLNMGWRILVFYPEPEASTIYFDSDMSEYKYSSIL
jgi:hypothetical protein